MDFTQELLMFQGALTSADNVHKFSRLTSKGGNEEKVNSVLQSVKRFLQMEKYIDEHGLIDTMVSTTRKFAMYVVLNADLTVLQDMMDIPGIEPVIWTIPTVPKYLMCEMMWNFHMDKFVYEIISNCWPQLGLEVAEAFLENFKYFDPTECLNKLYKLSTACYSLLCRLTCFKFEDDVLSNLLAAVYSTFECLLKYYIEPPNKYKLDSLNDDDLYKYKGKRLKSMLFLVFDCCNLFSQNFNQNFDEPTYKLTYNEGYLENTAYKACDSPNRLVIECLHNSNTLLLDIFKEVVMDVSVDIFCAWSEYEEDGKSVQHIIGELCDKIQNKLQSISSMSEHPVVSMIQLMARKPTEIKDIINSTDTDTIIEKINNNDEHSPSWIHALVNKENLDRDLKLIKVVNSNLSIFNDQECLVLYNALKDATISEHDDNQILINLKINLVDKCNSTDKHKILKDHFKDKMFTNTIISDGEYECKLNEMFNKFIVDSNVDFTDVLTVFYQNPKGVYMKIFTLAIQNAQLMEPMLKLMTLFKEFTEHYYNNDTEPCTVMIMKSMALNNCYDSKNKNNLIKFICGLKKQDLISSSRLLMMVIMPSMHSALVKENILQMHVQVQLLIEAYTIDELLQYRPPMLVMMGQVMELVRCRNIDSFQVNAIQTLEITIQFQKSIMDTYQGVIPDTDGSWLRYKVKELNMSPMNCFYFRSLWNVHRGNLFQSVTEQRIYKQANLRTIAVHLIKVIPRSILDEWCEVWDNFIEGGLREKHALHLFHSTIDGLTNYVEAKRSENSLACLFYCYRNLMHIIRYKYFKEPLTNSQVITCVHMLSLNLGRANPQDANEIVTIIGPLLAYLATRKSDYTIYIKDFFVNNVYFNIVRRFIPGDNE